MGLFSGSKKYVAYAGSSGLFEDLPGSFKNNIVQSTVSNSSKPGAVIHTIMTDQHARAKSMMRYAARYDNPAKEGGYVRGFPTSNMSVITVNPEAVEQALGRAVGAYDSVSSTKAGSYSESFFLSALTQAQWPEWDENDEEVTLPDGSVAPNPPEYLRTILGPNYDENDNYNPSPWTGKYDATWTSPTSTHTLELDVAGVLEPSWVLVKYLLGTRTHYWYYQIDSGVDPIFESAIDSEERNGEFLPVAVLMQDKVWFNEDPESELTITTDKLMKKFATSGTKIREQFEEQEAEDNASGDKNKSNAEKWDFFIHFATQIDAQVRGSKEYLWEFFQDMKEFTTTTSDDYYSYLASASNDRYGKAQPISELNITEGNVNGYNVNYRWSFIETREFDGEWMVDDPLAEVTPRPMEQKEIANEQWQRSDKATEQKPEYQSRLDDFFGEAKPIGLYDPKHQKNADNKDWERYGYHDYVIMTKQLEVPEGDPPRYAQTLVMGLSMQYVINTKDDSSGKNGYNFRYATPHMFGLEEETKEFRIPMHWGALQRVPIMHREEAVSEAMCGTVFLVEVIKTKWYQSGFFMWLLIIIAIVLLVIVIWFPPLITAAIGVLGAALGGTAIAMFIAYVIVQFAIGYMIALGTSLMSPGMQKWFAIAIFIAMIYTGQFSNIKGSISAFSTAPGWGTAATMINAVGPVYNMGFSLYKDYTIGKYEDEFRDLVADQRERQQELEDAWDSFGDVPSHIDPLELGRSFDRAGASEQPSSYYARVLHPNPGVLGYSLITEWSGHMLSLPTEDGQQRISGMMNDFEIQRG